MPSQAIRNSHTCTLCLQVLRRQHATAYHLPAQWRQVATSPPSPDGPNVAQQGSKSEDAASIEAQILKSVASNTAVPEQGAMSRRLEQATEDALLEGGRAGRAAVEAAGFSEDLKAKLLERVESSKFKSENATAFATANLPSSAGQGTRYIAAAQAWTGNEATEDSVLRMLNDAHKPLAPGLRARPRGVPGNVVDLRLNPKPKRSTGERLANARDKASIYAVTADSQMSDKQREDMRKELKERFAPAARAMPSDFRGLAALANERIEDAIARGQFKNIPRGKAIVRDARADNPFIDTTEYIMNKMIQRQDIVPPWIEKQQELIKTANNFRARIRFEWKRHVARSISSRGGSLQEQVNMANKYAESELLHNPKRKAVEQISVPLISVPGAVTVKIEQNGSSATDKSSAENVQVTLETKDGEIELNLLSQLDESKSITAAEPSIITAATIPDTSETPAAPITTKLPPPFRDPNWEATEASYLRLAVENLNSIARSYNLMAPDLAKKGYYTVEREMNSCYADVAPLVAEEIIDRARRPAKPLVEVIGHRQGGIMEKFNMETASFVKLDRRKEYGFKELWEDLWGGSKNKG